MELFEFSFNHPVIVIFGLLTCLNLVATIFHARKLVYIFKPSVIITLLVALYQISSENLWLSRALLFSLIGDILLMLPKQAITFISGLVSFLFAHLMYIRAFYDGERASASIHRRIICFFIISLVFLPLVHWLLKNMGRGRDLGAKLNYLRLAVGLYTLTITAMGANVVSGSNLVAIIGALLFAFSDILICWYNFIVMNREQVLWVEPMIIATYHIAQFCLFWVLR